MREVISACVKLAASPLPFLGAAFELFDAIWKLLQAIEASEDQLTVLTECIAHLLITLDAEYRAGRLKTSSETNDALADLLRLLEEIRSFIQKQRSYSFIKVLIVNDQRLSEIEGYHRRLAVSVNTFHISALIRIQDWQAKNDEAREADQKALHARLGNLEANQEFLLEALNLHQNNAMAMLASLKRRIDDNLGGPRELQFFSHAYRCVATASGQQDRFELEPWTVSRLDVEFGVLIGVGGFGKVYSGTWNQTKVALKVMKGAAGVIPHPGTIHREIATWSKLRHPHILQFLGANILDDEPFIVMPLIQNGNARNYIQDNPACDRLKLLHHVSLGLVYLHSNNVIHGDIKGVNILIDDGERALLCDFGLAKIKAEVNSRTTSEVEFILGSRNWMAPELMDGGVLRKACDVYSFGMTMYEIYTTEIPLGHISPIELRELVAQQNVRPARPDKEEAPQLSEETWTLAERCWAKEPGERPTAAVVCQILSTLVAAPEDSASSSKQPIRDTSASTQLPPSPPDSVVLQNRAKSKSNRISAIFSSMSISNKQQSPSAAGAILSQMPAMSSASASSSSSSFSSLALPFRHRPAVVSNPMNKPYTRTLTLEHLDDVTCLAISPNGATIACGTRAGHIQIWDAKKGISLAAYHAVPHKTAAVTAIGYSPVKPTRIVYGTAEGDAMGGSTAGAAGGRNSKMHFGGALLGCGIRAMRVAEGGKRAVAYAMGDTVWTWKMDEAKGSANGIGLGLGTISGVGGWHASNEVQVPVASQRTLRSAKAGDGAGSDVLCVALEATGRRVVTGHRDGSVVISETETGQQARRPLAWSDKTFLDDHRAPIVLVAQVAVSPDGLKVAACYSSGEIRLWDVMSGDYKVLREPSHDHAVEGGVRRPPAATRDSGIYPRPIAFSSHGTRVAYPSTLWRRNRKQSVTVQDIASGTVMGIFDLETVGLDRGMIVGLTISLDDKKMVLSFEESRDVVVWVWD